MQRCLYRESRQKSFQVLFGEAWSSYIQDDRCYILLESRRMNSGSVLKLSKSWGRFFRLVHSAIQWKDNSLSPKLSVPFFVGTYFSRPLSFCTIDCAPTVNWLSLPCRVRRHGFEETTVWDMLPMNPNLTLMTVSLNGFRVPSQLLWVEPQLRCVLMMSSWSTHNTTVQAHVVWKELWESTLLISDTSWLLLSVQASGSFEDYNHLPRSGASVKLLKMSLRFHHFNNMTCSK